VERLCRNMDCVRLCGCRLVLGCVSFGSTSGIACVVLLKITAPVTVYLSTGRRLMGKSGLNALRRRSDGVEPRTGPVSLVKATGSRPPGIEIWFFDSLANNLVIIRTELCRLCVGSVRKGMELRKRH
jgi:hypothetical protein